MKKSLLLFVFLAASASFAAELVYRNAFFQVTFDTKGGSVKNLIHKKENWNGSSKAGNSFADVRLGSNRGPKVQDIEDFSKLDFALKEWKSLGTNTVRITFTACGTVFKNLRLTKSYFFNHYKSDRMEVEYTLENTGKTPFAVSLSSRSFFHRSAKNNIYFQPQRKGLQTLVSGGKIFEAVKLPPKRFLAVAADDKSGMMLQFPADSTAGFMNWFLKEGFPTQEFFSDERTLAPGEKRSLRVNMIFAKDIPALMNRNEQFCGKIKGTLPCQVEQLELQEDPSFKMRYLRPEVSKDTDYVDITLNRQFNDSWRSVTLPESAVKGKIAVFQIENKEPSFDRPVEFFQKGRELLLFIPGLSPGDSEWRAGAKNGFFQKKFGAGMALGPIAFPCRIFFNRPDGRKSALAAPAGGELYLNGNYEEADPANPKIPRYSQFVANPNERVQWLTSGGFGGSRCLQGGAWVALFPEKDVQYQVSLRVKATGGGARTWCYLRFYDAEGKSLEKNLKLIFCTDNAYDWKLIRKKFYAPEKAAMMKVTISRSRKPGCTLLIDDFSVKAAPVTCVKLSPKAIAKAELVTQWDVPVDLLEQFSMAVETPHKKWFVPAEKTAEILYMPAEHGAGRMFLAKRSLVEFAQRMPMKVSVIPLLRKVISSTGAYSVWVMTFEKTLSAYTRESIRELRKAPRLVYVTDFQEAKHDRDILTVWQQWQKEGTNFFFYGCVPPKCLKGKRIASPVHPVVPKMRNLSAEKMLEWYQTGNSYVVRAHCDQRRNPAVPAEDVAAASYVSEFYGRDFPCWEYSKLIELQALRFLSGVKPAALIAGGTEQAVELKVAKHFAGTLEAVIRNRFRMEKARVNIPVKLSPGTQKVALPDFKLPGGTFVAELRLISGGKVADAGVYRFDRPESVPLSVTFANKEKIFPKPQPVAFTVNLKNVPAGSTLSVEVEDSFLRIIAREEVPAKAVNTFKIALPEPRTMLSNLLLRVKKEGRVLTETIAEFSSPAGKPDLEEFYGLNWSSVTDLKIKMGLDHATLGGIDWGNTPSYLRHYRLMNLDSSPMGMYDGRKTEMLYRSDRKSDPVRNPCFSDPAFQKANRERIEKYSKVNRFRYYDVQNYWSGDEQFLGASVCYSPHCLKLFREYLKKQYGTIGALNKEWNSSFASFDAVVPKQIEEVKDKNNLSPWLDHKLFMSQVYAMGQFGFFAKELAKHTSDVKFGPSGTSKPGLTCDWYQMLKYCRLFGYYGGIQGKLIHDFGGKNVRAGQWGCYCHPHIDQEQYAVNPLWEGLIRGANMAAVWPPSMVNGDGTPMRNFFHVSRSLLELKRGIGKMWLSAERKPEIAILYSQSSLYCAMNGVGGTEWQNSQSSWVKLIEDLKYDCRYISYEQLAEKGVPAEYKVLILPCSLSLSAKESANIVKFVKRGGTVIADYAPGRYDGHGKRWNNPELASLFAPNPGVIKPDFKEIPALKGRLKAGEPAFEAVQVKNCGKGKAVNLNLDLSQYHFIQLGGTGGELSKTLSGDARFQLTVRNLVEQFLTGAKVRREVRVLGKSGADYPCIAAVRYDGANKVLALHVSSTEGKRFDFSKAVPVTVKLASKAHVYDVREGKYLGFTDSFPSSLLPAWCKMYSLQKSRITGLKLTVPASLKAGKSVTVKFTAQGAIGPQVFHVELKDVSGESLRLYTKNYHTVSGEGSCTMQIPFNAAKGAWSVEVTHVNSGMKAKRQINLN